MEPHLAFLSAVAPKRNQSVTDYVALVALVCSDQVRPFLNVISQTTDYVIATSREVETYFVTPLLEELGYEYEDITIGYPVRMFKGVQKTSAEADFVVFKGPDRDEKGVLLVIEAKKSDKGITVDHISQAKSYAQELLYWSEIK